MNKRKTGTREWSDYSFNIGIGCSNGCLYCYAKAFALDKGIVASEEEWLTEKVNCKKAAMVQPKYAGVVMFPTTHDITPAYLESFIIAMTNMLQAGNKVLVVTKARLDCMERMCAELVDYKDTDQLEFRVTVGSVDPAVCEKWEPGAPLPEERIAALKHAYDAGYETSVSVEPMLEGADGALQVVHAVAAYVSGDVWIGKMNKIDVRVKATDSETRVMVQQVQRLQGEEEILSLYEMLKDEEPVKWKDSIKQVLLRNDISV